MKDKLGKKKDSTNFKLNRVCPNISKNNEYHYDFSKIQFTQNQEQNFENQFNYYYLDSFRQNRTINNSQHNSLAENHKNNSPDSVEKLSEAFNIDSSLTKQHNLSSSQYSSEYPSQHDQSMLKKTLSFMDDSEEEPKKLEKSVGKFAAKSKKFKDKKETSMFSTQESKKQRSYQGGFISFQSREKLHSIKEQEEKEANSYKKKNNKKKKKKNKRNQYPIQENKPEFMVDLDRIEQSKKTTLMIKNIPNKYSKQLLLEEINARFAGKYDFFYLPMDFQNNCNLGYAFINFVCLKAIRDFYQQFHGQKWNQFNSDKICQIKYARIQGKEEFEEHLKESTTMKHSD